jgi:hypothetical protein
MDRPKTLDCSPRGEVSDEAPWHWGEARSSRLRVAANVALVGGLVVAGLLIV